MLEFIVFTVGFIYLLRRIDRLERAQKGTGDTVRTASETQSYYQRMTGEEEVSPKIPAENNLVDKGQYDDEAPIIPVFTGVADKASSSTAQTDREFEFKVGSKLFAGVGMLAVLLGVGFFLRFAFENNLITETMRVVLGMCAGAVLIILGWASQKKYAAYSAVLTGGGIGLFYISLYASYNFYALTSQPVTFFSMAIVTAFAIVLAVFYDAISLAGFALLGGFLTPFLLPSSVNSPHALFLYILLLNLGVFGAAWYKSWPQLTLGAFFGTVFVMLMWQGSYYTDAQFFVMFGYSTLFFLLFAVITLMHQLLRQGPSREAIGALMFLAPGVYFLQNYFLIDRLYPDMRVLFALGLGFLYVVLGVLLREEQTDQKSHTSQFYFAIAITFFAIAIPIYLHQHWITIGWAVQGLVVLLIGLTFRMRIMRRLGFGILLLSIVRLFAFDSLLSFDAVALWNSRNLTFLILIVSTYAGAIASTMLGATSTIDGELDNDAKDEIKSIEALLYIIGYALCVWGVTLEINSFHETVWFAIWWSLLAVVGVAQSFIIPRGFLRGCAYVVMLGAVVHIVFYDASIQIASYVPILNMRVVAMLVGAGASACIAFLMKKYSSLVGDDEHDFMKPTFFILFHGLLLGIVSLEVLDIFNMQIFLASQNGEGVAVFYNMQRAALSVAWILYAVGLLLVGIWLKSLYARRGAIVLFGAAVFKVFLYDTLNLTDFYRFISFISLGIILLFAGFLYYRFQDRILHFIDATPSN